MSRRNFDGLASYIFDYSGIKMPASKKSMLEGRLRRRQRALGAATLDDYCDYLFRGDTLAREGLHVINAVTTNKTDFFREPFHFDYLANVALPALKERGLRTLRTWSVACSTGPEPYTMAMVLDDFAERHGGPRYRILATDLDTEVLETARAGIYPPEMLAPVPPVLLQKYVVSAHDRDRHEVRIVPALRSAIGFARLNLMDERYPVGDPIDVIFCRNVLIYFDKPTQRRVVSQLADCLAVGGYLFLGHSESIAGMDLPLVQVANSIFQRVEP
jgi:chemotaxis protein methyltransferase CheR